MINVKSLAQSAPGYTYWTRALWLSLLLLVVTEKEFTADDVRNGAGDGPWTNEVNAVGPIFRFAARKRLIEPTGKTITSKRPDARSRQIRVWRVIK